MASYPTYNDNDWIPAMSSVTYDTLSHEEGEPFNNYALVGAEAPGSTFKLATATAALDDGLITPDYTYVDPGSFTLPTGQVLDDAPGDTGGDFDLSSAISYSSDVFFYHLGELFYDQSARYGATPIQTVATEYGLGVPSAIDLPNVNDGQVDSLAERTLLHRTEPALYGPPTWYVGDNVEMAFGQGETLVTPLEVANAHATFANGGTRYAPEVAAAIEGPNGALVRRIAPKVIDRVALPASTYQAMLAGFQGAVSSPIGTAYADFRGFDFAKWNLAGKTGTATTANTTEPVSWFVAFGGPKGQPATYAFCVEIDEAGYGADAAAPVVRELADYLMAHPLHPLHLARRGSPSSS
jgi:penicillin-binding protein 2